MAYINPTEPKDLSPYLEMLRHPGNVWAGRKDSDFGTDFESDPKLSGEARHRRDEVLAMLRSYAPRLWWYSKEPYPPMDPMRFIQRSALFKRDKWGRERMIRPAGLVRAQELGVTGRLVCSDGTGSHCGSDPAFRPYQKGVVLNGAGYFLRYQNEDRGTASSSEFSQAFSPGRVPIFWRLGRGPMSKLLERLGPQKSKARILIEYWYHVPYNFATRVGVGNHQGDWEGVSMLVEIGAHERKLEHQLLATYFSEHDAGSWRCASKVSRTKDEGGHPEAFSAMGTHATYPEPGIHRTLFLTDISDRGTNWDTWNQVRPLELEPYYGYSGAWGEARMFSFMTGPLLPGPGYKSLPRENVNAERTFAELHSQCGV